MLKKQSLKPPSQISVKSHKKMDPKQANRNENKSLLSKQRRMTMATARPISESKSTHTIAAEDEDMGEHSPQHIKEIQFVREKYMGSEIATDIHVEPGVKFTLGHGQEASQIDGGEFKSLKNQFSLRDFETKFHATQALEERRQTVINSYLASANKKDRSGESKLVKDASAFTLQDPIYIDEQNNSGRGAPKAQNMPDIDLGANRGSQRLPNIKSQHRNVFEQLLVPKEPNYRVLESGNTNKFGIQNQSVQLINTGDENFDNISL